MLNKVEVKGDFRVTGFSFNEPLVCIAEVVAPVFLWLLD